ncbi:hypothetical protein [Paracoccus sp. (in: a-proteobacteria)]|uniref:hypothetical protein n=1 Tax=Paracoccus sp. TaxID=267 RepID=UPI004058F0CC
MEEDYISFLVYDSEGDIIRTGECLESLLADQANTVEGETVVENPQPGVITDVTHYWDGTAFVEYPPSPGDWAIFDHVNEVWTDPRPTNHDDDFNANDYSFDATYYVIPETNTLKWEAGVARRDNGRYAEEQPFLGGEWSWTEGVVYIYYDWDLATFVAAPVISAAYVTPRRILVGEYRGGDRFIDSLTQTAVDGARVYSNTLNGRSIETGTLQPFKLSNIDFYNFVANPDFDPNFRDWIETNPTQISRSHIDASEDPDWDYDKVRFTDSVSGWGERSGSVYCAPVKVEEKDVYRLSICIKGSDYYQYFTVGWAYSDQIVSDPTALSFVFGSWANAPIALNHVIKETITIPPGIKYLYPIVRLSLTGGGYGELSRLICRPLLGSEILSKLRVPQYYYTESQGVTTLISSRNTAGSSFIVTGTLQADENGEIHMCYLTQLNGDGNLEQTVFSYTGLVPGSIHYERRISTTSATSMARVGFQLYTGSSVPVKGSFIRMEVMEMRSGSL